MTELKTLKDMDWYGMIEDSGLVTEELRAEAIKWAKSIDKNILSGLQGEDYCYNIGKRNFIKEFFNLTEEELQ